MSSSEGENFEFVDDSGSESEGYAPTKAVRLLLWRSSCLLKNRPQTTKKAPAKPKAAPKPVKAATKAKSATTGKAKAAPKKKILSNHNDADESADGRDDASDRDVAGPSTANDVPNPVAKQKTASEKYSKVRRVLSRI